jgi:hypothetical protein
MPSAKEILLQLYSTRQKIFEYREATERYKLKEQILLDEIKARGIDEQADMPSALEWFMDSF